jgi:hypothetical protein
MLSEMMITFHSAVKGEQRRWWLGCSFSSLRPKIWAKGIWDGVLQLLNHGLAEFARKNRYEIHHKQSSESLKLRIAYYWSCGTYPPRVQDYVTLTAIEMHSSFDR